MDIFITMYPKYIYWAVGDRTGSDTLISTNGDYDALLSNVVNNCSVIACVMSTDPPHYYFKKR
jgi:hypothetical protein